MTYDDRLPEPLRARMAEQNARDPVRKVRDFGLDEDPTDAGAAVFLRQVADILREVLAEAGHR